MLELHEFRMVVEYIDQNGSTTMLRMKKDTGLFGTRLSKTLEAHPDLFILSENSQKVALNTDSEHYGNIGAMVTLYQERKQKKQSLWYMLAGGFALLLVVLFALTMLTSEKPTGPRPGEIPVPVDTAP